MLVFLNIASSFIKFKSQKKIPLIIRNGTVDQDQKLK